MNVGIIERLTDKGFGFVRHGSHRIFFHYSTLVGVAYDDLLPGEVVEFSVEMSEKGERAAQVSRPAVPFVAGLAEPDGVRLVHDFAEKLALAVAQSPSYLSCVEWRDLERMLACVFAQLGFDVTATPSSKDGGKDIVIACQVRGSWRRFYVEVKHWRAKRAAASLVRDFLNVVLRDGVAGGAIISTSGFSTPAFEAVAVIDRVSLALQGRQDVYSYCQTYARKAAGTWKQPQDLTTLVFGSARGRL